MSNARTATGILVKRNGTTIDELTEVTPGGSLRNKIETSTHNEQAESHVLGILRQNDPGFKINLIAGNSTHMAIADDIKNNVLATWQFLYPSGITRTGDGYVQSFTFDPAPVDGKQGATVVLTWAGPVDEDIS